MASSAAPSIKGPRQAVVIAADGRVGAAVLAVASSLGTATCVTRSELRPIGVCAGNSGTLDGRVGISTGTFVAGSAGKGDSSNTRSIFCGIITSDGRNRPGLAGLSPACQRATAAWNAAFNSPPV